MRPEDKTAYWSTLSQFASCLSDDGGQPFDLAELCARLNVRITRGHAPGKARAAVLGRGKSLQIVLSGGNDKFGLTREERFHVAHEIGHIILEREHSIVPLGASEYWQHEELCDAFASHLLVSDVLLKETLCTKPRNPEELLQAVDIVVKDAAAPWRIAAARVSQFLPSTALFKAKLWEVDKFKIISSSLPRKKEIGRLISSKSRLGRVLFDLRGRHGLVTLDASVFEESTIPICQGAREGALLASGYDELRLGVFLDSTS